MTQKRTPEEEADARELKNSLVGLGVISGTYLVVGGLIVSGPVGWLILGSVAAGAGLHKLAKKTDSKETKS